MPTASYMAGKPNQAAVGRYQNSHSADILGIDPTAAQQLFPSQTVLSNLGASAVPFFQCTRHQLMAT